MIHSPFVVAATGLLSALASFQNTPQIRKPIKIPNGTPVKDVGVYHLSTGTWIYPRETFYAYLNGLMDAGLGKRLMFGSDQMQWPEAIDDAVEAIESAPFLSEEQKRDIFYNNAARFLRLSQEQIAAHRGN